MELTRNIPSTTAGSPRQPQHSRERPFHVNSSAVPCCSAASDSHSSSAASPDSERGCCEQASWGSCWRSDQPPRNGSSYCSRECRAHWTSLACQSGSSDDVAGMQGVESVALGAETAEECARTAEECARTADTIVAGTDTADAGHNLLTGLLDRMGLPAVR
jgi:hypothetical protein